MEPILEIRGLSRKFSGFHLKNIDLVLPRGYIMGMIGPNGAGKTTLIRLIMNLLRRDTGSISIFGLDNRKHEQEVKQRIGFVYDNPSFYGDLSLVMNKRIISPFYKDWDDDRFFTLLREFELEPRSNFGKLSRGEQTKFALTIALSHNAELILMDEPTAGLDPIFRRELLEKLSGLLLDGTRSILFSTHITSDLDRIADYVTFISNGEVAYTGTKDEISSGWSLLKGDCELLRDMELAPYVRGVRKHEYGCEVLTDNARLARKLFRDSVAFEKVTLEDVMYYLHRGNGNGKPRY